MITDSRSNLAPSTKGCNKLRVLRLVGMEYEAGVLARRVYLYMATGCYVLCYAGSVYLLA